MANTSLSRNPFADPTLPTFADLIARISAEETLPLRTRQNWRWALGAVARAVGKDPVAVPAHPEFLRKLLDMAAPASIGLSRAGWNNARSLCGKALEWAGLASMPGHYQAPFTPAWDELWAKLPTGTALSFQLSRLFHWASAQGVEPVDMNDAALNRFHQDLMAESIVRVPYEVFRGATKSWNNAAERIAGWPQQRLTVPSRQKTFSLPRAAFPPSLDGDVEAYLRRAAGLDLSDDHFTRAQRPATIATRRWQLRLLATAIAKSGIAPGSLTDLRAMLVPEMVARGLQYLMDRNGGTSSVQISNIALFLGTLAARLGMPDDVIARLRKMARKLKVSQHGMTARNRESLRAFDDHTAVEALLGLPRRLLREVRASGRMGYREAKMIQTALAIELLLNAPVRIQNLASIDLGRHLLEVGSRSNRTVHLRFPAAEVKNRNDLEFPLMQEYMRLDMPAHRFRHAAAKIYLDRHPGEYELIRQFLGHKDIQTTIAFYAGAESASAARHYARTILEIRAGSLGVEARHG